MTTNRMGLEQALSDEQLEELITELELCGIYGRQVRALAELQKFRKASKKAVALTDKIELEDMTIHGHAKMFKSRRAMGKPDPDSVVKLYAASPIQAVTVPDGYALVPIEPTEDMVIAGFESEPDESFSELGDWKKYEAMSGCQQAAHRAKLCWAAMLKAAPLIQTMAVQEQVNLTELEKIRAETQSFLEYTGTSRYSMLFIKVKAHTLINIIDELLTYRCITKKLLKDQ